MRFEKVSLDQFKIDFIDAYKHYNLGLVLDPYFYERIEEKGLRLVTIAENIHHDITKPKRSTIGSAGYDFFYPIELHIPENITVKIPTGIAWNPQGQTDTVLSIYPRSSLGIKYSLREPNVVSIIDSDYYGCEQNGGHIFVCLRNEGSSGMCVIKAGVAYCQGIISKYLITDDDDTTATRIGGIGSTT